MMWRSEKSRLLYLRNILVKNCFHILLLSTDLTRLRLTVYWCCMSDVFFCSFTNYDDLADNYHIRWELSVLLIKIVRSILINYLVICLLTALVNTLVLLSATAIFLKSLVCRFPKLMLFLLTTHIRPVLEYGSCLWRTGFVGDMQKLERIQRRWTKRVQGLRDLCYSERLSDLGLFSIQGRLLRADLIQYWKIFHGKSSITPHSMFAQPQTDTRGHPLKIMVSRANTDIRQRFFSQRCVKLWNSLPAEVVTAQDLQSFKRGLVALFLTSSSNMYRLYCLISCYCDNYPCWKWYVNHVWLNDGATFQFKCQALLIFWSVKQLARLLMQGSSHPLPSLEIFPTDWCSGWNPTRWVDKVSWSPWPW